MITLKFNIKPYLAEYMSIRYSWPERSSVKIPPNTDLYHLMIDLLSRRPVNAGRDVGNIEFQLPHRSSGKRTETYNYLPPYAQRKIESAIYTMHWSEFHMFCEYQMHIKGESLLMSVLLFKSKYNIESLSQDAYIKNYQRWRDRQKVCRRTYKNNSRYY